MAYSAKVEEHLTKKSLGEQDILAWDMSPEEMHEIANSPNEARNLSNRKTKYIKSLKLTDNNMTYQERLAKINYKPKKFKLYS